MRNIGLYIIVLVILLVVAGAYLDMRMKNDNSLSLLDAVGEENLDNVELKNYGPAAEFAGIETWINTDPLTIQQLRGKVVMVDFWTYSCINCIRTLPYLTSWYEKYKDRGFVLVGVHTPEFAFEKDTGNVQAAMNRHGINYPVAQDNDYATWRAYQNRYWPAHYLIDQTGNIVYVHFGEGKYQETEQAIQRLLGISQETEMAEVSLKREIKTPEIYFGLKRLEFLSAGQQASALKQEYVLPADLSQNFFGLGGEWQFGSESVTLRGNQGKIKLNFFSKDVHMVAESMSGAKVNVLIDGVLVKTLDINESTLYTLFEGEEPKQRILELQIEGDGFEAYTFTFG